MSDLRRGQLEVGTLSGDGSRMWDGSYWVAVRTDDPRDQFPSRVERSIAIDFPPDRRTFGIGGVVLAAVVGIAMSQIHLTAQGAGSLDAALRQWALLNLLWGLFTFAVVVVILSIGLRGIDVMLLRALTVEFILGAAFAAQIPIFVVSKSQWIITMLLAGLIWAVLIGPLVADLAILLNLLWYRSLRSLRPQLGIFNRG